ncbi:MAG: nitroreductase family protein [Candidatus Omnitrophica bacterium]|nr:nitroreductase family protein [Candidatus Omnitrophota bacterium]
MRGIYKLILERRSIRKFKQKKILKSLLTKIINAARLAPSAANLQITEFLVVDKEDLLKKIFPYTRWAGYLKGKGTPGENQTPCAYVFILISRERTSNPDLRDVGACAQNLILTALSFGIASCWLASIDRESLKKLLKIPSKYELDSIVALGYPAQKSKVKDTDFTVRYTQDKESNLTVPKRPLNKVLHYNRI